MAPTRGDISPTRWPGGQRSDFQVDWFPSHLTSASEAVQDVSSSCAAAVVITVGGSAVSGFPGVSKAVHSGQGWNPGTPASVAYRTGTNTMAISPTTPTPRIAIVGSEALRALRGGDARFRRGGKRARLVIDRTAKAAPGPRSTARSRAGSSSSRHQPGRRAEQCRTVWTQEMRTDCRGLIAQLWTVDENSARNAAPKGRAHVFASARSFAAGAVTGHSSRMT